MGAYSHQFVDLFSGMANQAALARLPAAGGGVIAQQRYGQQNLTTYNAILALSTSQGGIALTAQYGGSGQYNESQIGLGYGKKLGKIDLGVQFNYAMRSAAAYGSDAAVLVELGTLWHITDRLHTGIHLFNPARGKYGNKGQEKIPWIYKAGIGYEASGKLLLTAEIGKAEERAVTVQAGIQYMPDKKLILRAGITTATTTPWLSAGWAWNNIRADITGSYHPQLGVTPGLLLLFQNTKKPIR